MYNLVRNEIKYLEVHILNQLYAYYVAPLYLGSL